MPESRSVKRRKAIQKVQWWSTAMLRKLSPEIRQALESKQLADIKDIDTFVLGFAAGRAFQHTQLARVLCAECMNNVPIMVQSGVPLHEVIYTASGKEVTWRKTCDAVRIYAFKP